MPHTSLRKSLPLKACLHRGGGPQVDEVTQHTGVVRWYVNAFYFSTTVRRVTSPTWGTLPQCKQALRVQITTKSNNYCSLLITTEHRWITWRRWKTSSGHTWCHGCQIKWEKLVSFPPKKEQLRYIELHAVKHIPTLRRSVIVPIPRPRISFLATQNGRRLRTFIYV